MSKTNAESKSKTFHIAFWHPLRATELMGVNYKATSITNAVELYAKDYSTPAISEIKYVFEVGVSPIRQFVLSGC